LAQFQLLAFSAFLLFADFFFASAAASSAACLLFSFVLWILAFLGLTNQFANHFHLRLVFPQRLLYWG
jgi:hypothetical protein